MQILSFYLLWLYNIALLANNLKFSNKKKYHQCLIDRQNICRRIQLNNETRIHSIRQRHNKKNHFRRAYTFNTTCHFCCTDRIPVHHSSILDLELVVCLLNSFHIPPVRSPDNDDANDRLIFVMVTNDQLSMIALQPYRMLTYKPNSLVLRYQAPNMMVVLIL